MLIFSYQLFSKVMKENKCRQTILQDREQNKALSVAHKFIQYVSFLLSSFFLQICHFSQQIQFYFLHISYGVFIAESLCLTLHSQLRNVIRVLRNHKRMHLPIVNFLDTVNKLVFILDFTDGLFGSPNHSVTVIVRVTSELLRWYE